MDKGGADFSRGGEGEQWFLYRVLQHQSRSCILQPVEDLRADLHQLFPDLRGELVAGLLIAENFQIDQQCHRNIPPVGVIPVAGIPEHIVEGAEGIDFLRTPRLSVGAAQSLKQLPVLSRPLEDHKIQPGHLVEIQKLVVGHHLRIVRGLGQQPGDYTGDGDGAEVFQHAHPLVALHHVKVVEVLHRLDGVPDALLQVGLAQVRPLVGKLTLLLEHGVKAPGEGIFPQIVAGAVNQFAGDLHHTQRFPPHRQGIRIFRQDPQARFFSPGNGLLLLLQTLAHRFMILFQRHKLSPLKPKNRAARTGKPTFLSTRYHGGKKISIVFLFEKY